MISWSWQNNSMADVPILALQDSIRSLHGCESTYLETVRVIEDFEDQRGWEGNVYVFALADHPTAKKCYAWTHFVGDTERRRFETVLHEPPVNSPQEAVRAALVQEYGDHKI